ncbi:hypothetical protein DICPUDRAFT_99412 [Dictyostelium purpureum]|uniref:Equilibrative nucleoside transporter n=1 Tax=Dictyostelium purpureum TaxID=5786 RepID=F0ZZ09_DICPU|nr:uncharacterized protein DICPUDRAFT_99412 [Dictyostelium purpureum]EGC30817.1 hypothetical protein DICPUDRAFT_99412 [Dictyostelium purpureum]|eukprot:XP_003292660.1 hypothetical protein DICPUDRAFT_99412 [Dictyostelium purpureum]
MGRLNKHEYSPLVESDITVMKPPPDRFGLAWFCFLVLGIGLLLPFNCFITSSAYYNSIYPNKSYTFLMSLAYNYFQWILLFVSSKIMPKFSFKSRMFVFFLILAAILFWMPFNDTVLHKNETTSMIISLLCTLLAGCSVSLLFGTVMGLVALFPGDYTGAVMSGNGVAGIIASVFSIITTASVSNTPEGFKKSSYIFFFLAAGVMILCLLCFVLLLQLPFTKYFLTAYEASKTKEGSINDVGEVKKPEVSIFKILRKVWREALVVFLVFFTTLSVFPGITGLIQTSESKKLGQTWFQIYFVLTFMIGDFIGRTLPKWLIIFKPNTLWIPTVLRLAFFPLFSLCVKPVVFDNFAWQFIFMFIFALSNGYCGTLAMIFGPTKAEDHEKEYAGIIMTFMLNFGIWVSTHFSFLVLYLVTGSTGISF